MALAAPKTRKISAGSGVIPDRRMGITAAAVVYQGAYLTHPADGAVNPYVEADGQFAGVAAQTKTGGASDGDESVMVHREGMVRDTVVGATSRALEGQLVYMTDDDTLTLTASTNVAMGRVEEWLEGTTCWIRFFSEASTAAALA